MTKTQRAKIEQAAWVRHCEQNWPAMIGGAIATVARMQGKRWIYKPATPAAMTDAIEAVRS